METPVASPGGEAWGLLTKLQEYPSPLPQALDTTDTFAVSTILPFPKCHIFGIRQYAAFLGWLLSLSNMHLGFFLFLFVVGSSFLFRAE